MNVTSIPAFHVSGSSKAKGKGDVSIAASLKYPAPTGIFDIDINVHFNPAIDNSPEGTLSIQTNLSDGARNIFTASTIEFINSFGKQNPTIYLTGQCKSNLDNTTALDDYRYWVMVVNNNIKNKNATPGIVGFCIHDCKGNRIAYGTSLYGNIDAMPN